jgi:branched-chain amino acid aminotransferase
MEKIFFLNGKFLPESEAKVSVTTHSFNYGTGVFEGIRAFWNNGKQQLFVLALKEHLMRFKNSCKILKICLPHSVEELSQIVLEILRVNNYREDVLYSALSFQKLRKNWSKID